MSGSATSTCFTFEHKVFAIGGCHFSSAHNGDARFKLPMGEGLAAIAFPALRQEFGIAEDSADGQLLETVAAGLRFVKVICPDDEIPPELLDGSASWSVGDEHRVTAKNRLIIQLITWMSGSEEVVRDAAQLEQMADNPETLAQLKAAFKEMAERIGAGEDGEKEIISRLDRLAHEHSYIEGLWAYFTRIQNIGEKIEIASRLYRSDATIKETLVRLPLLLKPAIDDLEFQFDQLEAQSEITKALENWEGHIKVIREARDALHLSTKIWKELAEQWQKQPLKQRSHDLEGLVMETYRFLAQNFPQAKNWELTY